MSESKEVSVAQEFRHTIDRMGDQFLAALPAHIPVDKFKRTVITAVTMNPDLMQADRRTLLASCMKAASDGLLLDGRDAALVKFGSDVAYMPMIGGVLKRMRQSGEIKAVATDVVHAGDTFEHWRDEAGEHFKHVPLYEASRGDPTLAYAMVQTTDGGVYIEVMDKAAIEKVRNVSRAKSKGPWVDWWSEMARKTVMRRLAKRLPMSTELDDFMRRDDELSTFGDMPTPAQERPSRPRALDAVVGSAAPAIEHDGAPAEPQSDTRNGGQGGGGDWNGGQGGAI